MITKRPNWVHHEGLQIFSIDIQPGDLRSATTAGDQKGMDPIDVNNKPLWKHVAILERLPGGGGNVRFRCKYCAWEYCGSYYRVKAHLLKKIQCHDQNMPKSDISCPSAASE